MLWSRIVGGYVPKALLSAGRLCCRQQSMPACCLAQCRQHSAGRRTNIRHSMPHARHEAPMLQCDAQTSDLLESVMTFQSFLL